MVRQGVRSGRPSTRVRPTRGHASPRDSGNVGARRRSSTPTGTSNGKLIQAAPDAVVTIDSRGLIHSFNKAAERVFGYTAREAIGQNVRILMPPFHAIRHPGYIAKYLKTGRGRFLGTPRLVTGLKKDGSEVRLYCSAIEIRAGRRRLFTAFFHHLPENLHAQAAAGKDMKYLQGILDNSLDVICTVRKDGAFGYLNPRLEEVTGHKPEAIRGKSFMEFIPEHRKEFMLGKWEEINRGIGGRYETEIIKADGTLIHVQVSHSVVEGFDEFLVALQDITESKRAQEEIRRRSEEMEKANRELEDVTRELESVNRNLDRLSREDPLTGLLNRRGLEQALSREIQRLETGHLSLIAVLFDLDDFKVLNDRLGHAVGDVVLREVARTIRETLRTTDHSARTGGDEFLILLPRTGITEALRLADRLRAAVRDSRVITTLSGSPLTASLGLVSLPHDATSVEELLSLATPILSRSKQEGKNKVTFEHEGAVGPGVSRDLPSILESFRLGNNLYVVSMGIHRLSDGRQTGVEFLSRSTVPGYEASDDFLRLCREHNIQTIVDRHCFKHCLEAAADSTGTLPAHINLFPNTLLGVPVAHLIEDVPKNLSRDRLCIELSERYLLGNASYLVEPLRALKEAGIRIAMDDVGFGHSCLESLVVLEPHLVKIDQGCVTGLEGHADKIACIERLLKIARSLNMEVIAEGIESPSDLAVLKTLGVEYGQGFYWGPPA